MQRITVVPSPPVGGKSCKICYDFSGSGISSTTLKVLYSPTSAGTNSVNVTVAANCEEITCAIAESLVIEDAAGPSDSYASSIL
jgi:hypothetical protein